MEIITRYTFLLLLLIGFFARVFFTSNGNFIFNMDNARDMVDVREMVVLGKPRLIGPTSAIDGVFDGPFWYYLLAIPFIISGGDPYFGILLQIFLWLIGGYFLYKITKQFGFWAVLISGSLWMGSDYIFLTNLYAYNPNPVTLLTPLLIFLIYKYIKEHKLRYSILSFLIAGLFFNLEMNYSIFIPFIIIASFMFYGIKKSLVKDVLIGFCFFLLTLLPQIFFDFRHNFLMSESLIQFLLKPSDLSPMVSFNLKLINLYKTVFQTIYGTMLNNGFLVMCSIFLITVFTLFLITKRSFKNHIVASLCAGFIFIPLIGYVFIPVKVNPWHLGTALVSAVILISIMLKQLLKGRILSKLASIIIGLFIVILSILNLEKYLSIEKKSEILDPSFFKNEISAIDYVYQEAKGENFKVFVYMPSVYDYPYQYLFWWYGKKKYGFIPYEYAYLRNKPQYIASKQMFEGSKENFNGLVFLIMEPDTSLRRAAWLGDFNDLKFIKKEKIGSIEIETRMEEKY